MHPVLIDWGPIFIPAWHGLFALGSLLAYFYAQYLNKKFLQIDSQKIAELFAVVYVSGYFGARIFAILVEEQSLNGAGDFLGRLFVFGPMTFYGGFLASIGCGFIYCRINAMDSAKCLDLGVTAGFLALALGRVGCFLNGDDYGIPVILSPGELAPWWSVSFPNHPTLIPRYPVQLIEAGYALMLCVAGSLILGKWRHRLAFGSTGLILIDLYAFFRFLIEFWRGDDRGWSVDIFYLSPAQVVSVVLLIAAKLAFLANRK